MEDAKAIPHRQTRGDDQEGVGEAGRVARAGGVEGLPGNQHTHDGGLASTGRQLERDSQEVRIGLRIQGAEALGFGAGATSVRESLNKSRGIG